MEEDNEGYEIHKPHMKNAANKKQITNPMVNTIFIFDLQMNNNCRSVEFGMYKSKDDMLSILGKSTIILVKLLGVFA